MSRLATKPRDPYQPSCEVGLQHYECSDVSYTGCCSFDPCLQGTCHDNAPSSSTYTHVLARSDPTMTVTKILARGESVTVTTVTSKVTITSTVYNHSTTTSTIDSSNLLNNTNSVAELAASLKPAVVTAPSITKPTATAATDKPLTKTSTLAPITTTKALVFTGNKNATAQLKKADPQNAGKVAGITIGSIAGIVLVTLLVFLCCRSRARRDYTKRGNHGSRSVPSTPVTPVASKGSKVRFTFAKQQTRSKPASSNTNMEQDTQISRALRNLELPSTLKKETGRSAPTTTQPSQIHPAFRGLWSDQATSSGGPRLGPSSSVGSASRFYTSNEKLRRDTSTESRMTACIGVNPTTQVSRNASGPDKRLTGPQAMDQSSDNQSRCPPTPSNKTTVLEVPLRDDRSETRSLNSSILQTPTSMIGPVRDAPQESPELVHRENIGQAISSRTQTAPSLLRLSRQPRTRDQAASFTGLQTQPRTINHYDADEHEQHVIDQSHPDYKLPSQRFQPHAAKIDTCKANYTASIWTNASVPYSPGLNVPPLPLPPAPLLTRIARKPSPSVVIPLSESPVSLSPHVADNAVAGNRFALTATKSNGVDKDAKQQGKERTRETRSEATTTESDVLSPTHEGQERVRRRMSLWSPVEETV